MAWRPPRGNRVGRPPGPPGPAGLLDAAGHRAVPTLYSHTEGRLLPYDAEAAPIQRCLWAAVTASARRALPGAVAGLAEQHAYGSMPAAAMDKVSEHLHAAHDALARMVPCVLIWIRYFTQWFYPV